MTDDRADPWSALKQLRRVRVPRKLGKEHQAERLRRLRVAGGRLHKLDGSPFTTTEMAELLSIKQQQYSAYETRGDKPSPKALAGLKDYLGVTADWVLLGDDDSMPHYLLQALNAVTLAELGAIKKKRR
jgi:transcriptional regulator with XRE-family HTH domain